VAGHAVREPVATNFVAAVVANVVPVFMTNVVQVPVTNLVAKPEAVAAIEATGSVANTIAPGIGRRWRWRGCIIECKMWGLEHRRSLARRVDLKKNF
jgi:hypothetical protein